MPSALVSEADRRRHTYITGGSGSGKSELIKVLVHNYVSRPGYCSTVIIDPHGDLAKQIASWKEFAGTDRLIYIDPTLSSRHTPIINPFEIKNKSTSAIDLAAQEIACIFKELVEGAGISLQMQALLTPCIATVIRMGGTLEDLFRFMNDDRNHDLVAEGLRSPNIAHGNFFKLLFRSGTYNETKRAIMTRIQSLFNTQIFYNLTVGKSTLDLKQELQNKKTIVFSLAKGKMGREASDAFGRLLITLLYSIAIQRADIEESARVPVHIFIDECHFYITKSIENILSETRKYGTHLTLAQQIIGQEMDQQLTRIVLGNTAVKFAGHNGSSSLRKIAQETGAEIDMLQSLKDQPGTFLIQAGKKEPQLIKIPDTLLGKKNSMNEDQWERMKEWQLKRYYKCFDISEDSPPPDSIHNPNALLKPKFSL